MTLEIVTHCYRYSTLLKFQLSSLAISPPQALKIVMTVFYSREDEKTVQVLNEFAAINLPNVRWNWQPLPTTVLCRRSIGRNLAALKTRADWVWFTDADYLFFDECWIEFENATAVESDLVYPGNIWIHKTHDLGDKCISRAMKEVVPVRVDSSEFRKTRISRAIGGVQIVRGEWCRLNGYLPNDPDAQRPAEVPGFTRCFQDAVFRKHYGKTSSRPACKIDLPGVYRIRHSRAGRQIPGLEI